MISAKPQSRIWAEKWVHRQVRPKEAKVSAIAEFPVPTSRKELRRFLGMAGYYRNFCKNFSTVVSPLTSFISPLRAFLWSDECQNAFENVKALLCSVPVFAAPAYDKAFKLEIDASFVGAGAVLIQEDIYGLIILYVTSHVSSTKVS